MIAIEALRQVPLFAHLTDKPQMQHILSLGEEIWLEPGEKLWSEEDLGEFFVLLSGSLQLKKKVGDGQMFHITHQPGEFFGEIPLLLDEPFAASGSALSKCHLFRLQKDEFWQMLTVYPTIAQKIMRTMAQRVQSLESVTQVQERIVSLGTMAAGLSHELNNPAAASHSAAGQLRSALNTLQAQALKLYELQPTPEQVKFLAAVIPEVEEGVQSSSSLLDQISMSDREDKLSDWLEARGILDGWKLACTFIGAGLEADWLETLVANVPVKALGDVLIWLETALTARELVQQVEQGTGRISQLVNTVKEYSYMDRSPQQLVDVHEGIENTLTLLGYKLNQSNILVMREYDKRLPRLEVYGSELNQVWTNLIDNAIDALNGSGHIWIRTLREGDCVLVEIADDGPGIPPGVIPRIFEPFFTTKDVGKGTGLGLVTCYRIVVSRHRGDIRALSQTGNTRFQVRLPIGKAERD